MVSAVHNGKSILMGKHSMFTALEEFMFLEKKMPSRNGLEVHIRHICIINVLTFHFKNWLIMKKFRKTILGPEHFQLCLFCPVKYLRSCLQVKDDVAYNNLDESLENYDK